MNAARLETDVALSRLKHGFESRRERHSQTIEFTRISAYCAVMPTCGHLARNGPEWIGNLGQVWGDVPNPFNTLSAEPS